MAIRGKSKNPGYKKGSHWATCDSCGFVFRAGELRKTWDNFYVCDEDYETRHPQDFLRVREEKISADQPLRPDITTNTVAVTFVSDPDNQTIPSGTNNNGL